MISLVKGSLLFGTTSHRLTSFKISLTYLDCLPVVSRHGLMMLLDNENSAAACKYREIVPDFSVEHNKLSPETKLAV